MADKIFHLGEKVFVYQGPLLYDSKVIRKFDPVTQKIDYYDEKKKEHIQSAPNKKFPSNLLTEVCYMVHYQGWNAKWDEWVLPKRILEVNNENIMLKENLEFDVQEQERLKREALENEEKEREMDREKAKLEKRSLQALGSKNKSNKKTAERALKTNGNNGIDSIINKNGCKSLRKSGQSKEGSDSSIGDYNSDNTENRSKRKRLNGGGQSESKRGFTHHEIKVLIPDALKIILVNDWENITKNNKLLSLPAKNTVSKTLEDFSSYITREFSEDGRDNEIELEFELELKIFLEITESMKLYFEQCLGTFLLYRYERPQYSEILENGKESNLYDIYGTIFLLRMISMFPSILVMNSVDVNTIRTSKVYLDVLLNWLNEHREEYFSEEYENQSPWVSIMHG